MATTPFDSSNNTGVQQEAYAKKSWIWAQENMFFNKFSGKTIKSVDSRTGDKKGGIEVAKGTQSVVTIDDTFTGKAGDTVNFNILAPITGSGVVDDAILEGNEQTLKYYDFDTTLHQIRNAVEVRGMAKQRTFKNVREDGKDVLGNWQAQYLDTKILLGASGLANADGTLSANAPSSNRKWAGGDVVGGSAFESVTGNLTTNLDVGNLMCPDAIEVCKRKAMMPGSDYGKIRPIMYKGQPYYMMLVSPYQFKALKNHTDVQATLKDAWWRSDKNPIFSGASLVWDGVIIHESEKIETRLGDATGTASLVPTTYFELADAAANGVYVARALFLGAQAVVLAKCKGMNWVEQKRDYDNIMGISIGLINSVEKPEFNGEDFGVITMDTAYVGD